MPNEYDRIFKDLFENHLSAIMERLDGRRIQALEYLNGDLVGTFEWIVDLLIRVQDEEGHQKLLHIELQSSYQADMVERVAIYNAILQKRNKLPVESLVIFAGKTPGEIRTTLPPERVYTGFTSIQLQELPLKDYLQRDSPAVVTMGILSNFGDAIPEQVVNKIIAQIKATSQSPQESRQHLQRLLKLSRMVKLDDVVIEELKDMPLIFEIDQEQKERDPFYQMGMKQGIEQGRQLGQKQGREEGIEKGREQGRVEGIEQGEILAVLKMVRDGRIPREEAIDWLKTTPAEFDRLSKSLLSRED